MTTATLVALLTAAALVAVAIYPSPVAVVGACLVPLAALACVHYPVLVCTLFIAFSFFRIHEAYPILDPLSIPQGLGMMMLASLGYHTAVVGSIKPDWQTPLRWLALLLALVLFGLIVAKNRELSWLFVSEIYWKIVIVTFAIAWLTRTSADFRSVGRILIVSGALVACVAIYNKIYGISLVEGTRVAIARPPMRENLDDWTDPLQNFSTLADPNDLALILLFPLAFAMALLFSRTKPLDRTLGLIGCAVIMPAVIFTQSRGGLLGMIAVFGVLGLRRIKSRTVVIALCVGAAFALAIAMGLSSRVSGGAAEINEAGIDESARGRLIAWQAAINMMLARPLTGVGINGFVDAYFQYTPEWGNRDKAVHSTWFQVVGEMGFPGIFVFVAMFVATFRTAIGVLNRVASEKSEAVFETTALALVGGLAGFAVAGTFLTQAFTWPLYVLIALSVALNRATKATASTVTTPAKQPVRSALGRRQAPVIQKRDRTSLSTRMPAPAARTSILTRQRPAPALANGSDEMIDASQLSRRIRRRDARGTGA